MLEAAGCDPSLCRRRLLWNNNCGCAFIAGRSPGLTKKKGNFAKEVGGHKIPTLLPSEKRVLMLLGE